MDVSSITLDTNHTQSLDGVDESLLFKRSNISVTVLTSSGISIEAAAENVSWNAKNLLSLIELEIATTNHTFW